MPSLKNQVYTKIIKYIEYKKVIIVKLYCIDIASTSDDFTVVFEMIKFISRMNCAMNLNQTFL